MATESAASAHASHAARVLIAPTPVLRSFAPSVTTPLYRTTVSEALRQSLRENRIVDGYPNVACGKYEETIQFGWSKISENIRSTTTLAST